jgi:hypothetical protein
MSVIDKIRSMFKSKPTVNQPSTGTLMSRQPHNDRDTATTPGEVHPNPTVAEDVRPPTS